MDPRSNAELFIVRDANGHALSYLRREGAERGDDGDLSADEVGQQLRQAMFFAFQLVVVYRHVFALDVAGFAEAFLETADPTCAALGRTLSDKPDHRSWQCALSHEQSLQKRLTLGAPPFPPCGIIPKLSRPPDCDAKKKPRPLGSRGRSCQFEEDGRADPPDPSSTE